METGSPQGNLAVRLAAAAETARRMPAASVTPAEGTDFEQRLDRLARDLGNGCPPEDGEIGFDRPATVYIVPGLDPFGSNAPVLGGMIRARPWERHVVLCTARPDDMAYLQERIREFGGAAVAPDPSLGLFDRWLWLRAKLAAFAAQRLIFLPEPGDVLVRLAARVSPAINGARPYMVQWRCVEYPAGCPLADVIHLAVDPLVRRALRSANPGLRVGGICVPFVPGRDRQERKLPAPPLPAGLGRRAHVQWRLAREKWRVRFFATRLQRRLERSAVAGLIWQARIVSARLRMLTAPGRIVTATAGATGDFRQAGPLAFGSLVAATLRASEGIHLRFGPVTAPFRAAARAALDEAGLDAARLRFLPDETSVASAFANHRIDLFIGGFPVDQPGNRAQAAWAGLAQAIRKHENEAVAAPADALLWQTPDDLAGQIGKYLRAGVTERLARANRARKWSKSQFSFKRFSRRFNAILDRAEGSLLRPMDRSECNEAVQRFLVAVQRADAALPALFDAAHYLSSLPENARKTAARDPFAHYLLRGEALGHHPHPLFDPVLCAKSLARQGLDEAPAEGAKASVLGRYLARGGLARPHMFFAPQHYAGQIAFPPQGRSLLEDFLLSGAAEGLRPHPLIEPDQLCPKGVSGFPGVFLAWLCGDLAMSRQPHPLFEAGDFRDDEAPKRLANLAPTPLWAHLIEGNQGGRDPHLLISCAHVEKSRPGTLTQAITVLELIAVNRLLNADPHPLIDSAYIGEQAPWITQQGRHPLRYFLEKGGVDHIDPHPWFSTQFYLFNNPDVSRSGMNPLVHYLRYGQNEYRQPSGFFNGHQYYHRYILSERSDDGPLIDYVKRGAGLFWNTLWVDDSVNKLTRNTALALFEQECAADSTETTTKSDSPSAQMLKRAVHPESGARHPSLVTEKRALKVATPKSGNDSRDRKVFAAPEPVTVLRPAIVSPAHISPPSGRYEAAEIDAALYPDATVVAGNDGFVTASGHWLDHGLAIFDPHLAEVKGNAAVAAAGKRDVLLRRFELNATIAAGIFACGSYSKNYYHFLIETLPRALFAAQIAPAGTPLLTDDDMPAQHYQALRLFLPDNPIMRLARHRTYRVGRLFAASMPNNFQDAFLKREVPHDAVRLHPAALGKIAALSRKICPPDQIETIATPRKLFLTRKSKWRKLLNSEAIERALSDRGFTSVDFSKLSFSEQIRHMANADVVVAQSSAHLANMVFARPGCRVFALFSDAPGSNYHLWSGLGAPLGIDVVNIVGWRVPGSTGGQAPEAHEHFTVPLPQVTAFFPAVVPAGKSVVGLLDALHGAGAEADALTSAWALRAEPTPPGFEARLVDLRRRALAALRAVPESGLAEIATHKFFGDPWASLTSGLNALGEHDANERAVIDEIVAAFGNIAAGGQNLSDNAWRRLVLQASLMLPAWKVPLVADAAQIPGDVRRHYLSWLTMQPFLFRKGDDEGYVAFAVRLLDWLNRNMGPDRPEALRRQIAATAAKLDMGQLLLIEAPLRDVFTARNRLLDQIALGQGAARPCPRPADGSAGRRRIGILCRTFEKGPDSEAVVAIFRAFDQEKYEVFAYSVGFRDRVVSADTAFDRDFDAAITHRRLLPPDATSLRAQILADDLDVFLFANATTYGLRDQELALYHPVAPVQAVMNSHVPMSMGFPSFSAYVTGLSDHADHDVAQSDFPERLLRVNGPVISFLTSFKPRANPPLDRAALGLAEDDIVLMNAGSFQKLRRECLVTMMRAVRDVPRGVLLLAPYNPGWAARSQAFPFNRQLAETAAEVGLDPARIRVLSELTVAEAEAALSCADVYLNPFPHGGATMTHLALIYGIAPVTLRRRSTRSIDQFLIGSLGFPELLADSPDDYIALAIDLATDPARRKKISQALRNAARHPVFVDNPDYSRDMQVAVERLLDSATSA